MNLHRATSKADWTQVKPARQNVWQRVAAATNSIITPGNGFTLIGLALVIIGIVAIANKNYGLGATMLIVGRVCDLADGWIADRTGTKSPLGELLDSSIDKITVLLIVITLLGTSLIAWWVLVALIIPHVVVAGIVVWATHNHTRLHPSRAGKLSMATAWVGIIGLVLIQTLHGSLLGGFKSTVYILLIISILLNLSAIFGYLKQKN